jgi:hypothetical protein
VRRWHDTVRDVRDLETALKALEITAGSFEEVAAHYE